MKYWFLLLVIWLTACTSTPTLQDKLTFNGLIIENYSLQELHNVKIKVEKTGAKASCSLVLRGRSCSSTFPAKEYQGNLVHLFWEYSGKQLQLGPFYVEEPERINTERDATIVINFHSINDVTVKFKY